MTKTKLCAVLAAVLVLVLAAGQVGLAQKYLPDADVAAKIRAATQAITLNAQIGYDVHHGGYYIKNNPRYNFGNKAILNQNYQVLKKLARSGKTVTIRGRVDPLNFLATHLFIQSIDGKKYHGAQAPLVQMP